MKERKERREERECNQLHTFDFSSKRILEFFSSSRSSSSGDGDGDGR